ncbi:MAG: hypothetical protein P8X51_10200 [Maritimibacter sp.]|jgi:hypothetical protein
MKAHFALPGLVALLGLAACSTPQEACIQDASATYRSLLAQISTAEQNIARGYAVHEQEVPYTFVDTCYTENGDPYSCQQTAFRTQETPVSIDVRAEQDKLNALRARLPGVKASTERDVSKCRLIYPE